MKFLSLVCGIDAANPWFKSNSAKRWDMDQDWSAFDQTKGARSIDGILSILQLCQNQERDNCSRNPLFDLLPIDN